MIIMAAAAVKKKGERSDPKILLWLEIEFLHLSRSADVGEN